MIESQTVFILGAGASKPYEFPLGVELRQQILDAFHHPNTEEYRLLQSCGYDSNQIKSFRDNLHDSLHDTIDDFLTDRVTYREIGSHAIALLLMKCENHSKLFPKHGWYPHLFRLLDFKHENQLLSGIITLNYDRSIEHYLSHTISVSYEGEVKKKAEERLNKFRIYHIHGVLGQYPDVPYLGRSGLRSLSTDVIKKAAAELRITSDVDLDSSDLYAAARKLCQEAKTVVLLGFGYHMQVINRLELLNSNSSQKFLGSSYGIMSKQRQELMEKFHKRLSLDPHGSDIVDYFEQVLMQ